MIFVTVGTQMPFDRLVRAVDRWAQERGRRDVFAQVGPTSFRPGHIAWVPFLDSTGYRHKFEEADLLVAHAGMGSILKAMERGKPIVILPRRADLGEHRNDHQVDTARRLDGRPGIRVAFDEAELSAHLDAQDAPPADRAVGPYASAGLLDAVRRFIAGEHPLPKALDVSSERTG